MEENSVTKTAQLSCLLQKEVCVSNQRPTGDEALEANKRASEVRPERTNEGAKINRNEPTCSKLETDRQSTRNGH